VGIELLGPLRVDGRAVSLQRRDHVVLTALALKAGEVVPLDRLAEAIWGDSPPPSWPKIVQGCILRLRRTVGHELIETTPAGYRLAVTDGSLDTRRFQDLIERGRLLAAAGEPDRAAVVFGRALELWRGRPFEILDSWSPGQIERGRLEELRRMAEEGVLEARLQCGEHREVVPIAEVRVAEEPLREHRWALLGLALYRCGRQADALRALRQARHTLVEQLGIEPGAELVSLEAAILRQDESLLAVPSPPSISEHCPYKGLAPYDVDDTETFFGRDCEIEACVARLRASPVLVVTGASGCGKSSLVRAGLVPALRCAGYATTVFVPGGDPEASMADALADGAGRQVLVVDQFEEVLAVEDEHGTRLRSFCTRLAEYATTCAPVVITVRADHVAALALVPQLAELAERGLHLVVPLTGDALRQVIEGPAAAAGVRLEPGLVDVLVRDCEGEAGALPLLSHALAETWQRRDGRVLTVEGYRATGEIRGAVARSADRLYESLPAEQRPKLRSVLLRLVSPSTDGEPVCSRVATRILGGDAERERVLGLLVRARLVTAEQDTVEIAHEALVRAWPRLRSWLDEDVAGQRILRHLSAAADGWESLGRSESELYRGARLHAALEWRTATSPDLTELEAAFLEASVAAAAGERRAEDDRSRAQARQRRRLLRAVAGVVALLVALAAVGVIAYRQRLANRREQRAAAVASLAARSEALGSLERDVAALLAIEAYRMAPTATSESALFGLFTAAPRLPRIVHTGLAFTTPTTTGAYVPDSETLALSDQFGGVHLIDLATGDETRLDALSSTPGRSALAVSRSGSYVVGSWSDYASKSHSTLAVWDLDSGELRFEPVRVPYRVWSVAISADGSRVAASGESDERTQLRDGTTGRLVANLEQPEPVSDFGDVVTASVAFVPDGRLVVGSPSGPIRFFDPVSGTEVQRIEGPARTSEVALFQNGDGDVLITAGLSGVIAYDVESGQPRSAEAHPVGGCTNLAYAESMGAILCTDGPRVTAHDVITGDEFDPELDSEQGDLCGLIVSPDGSRLAEVTGCLEGQATIIEGRLDGGGPLNRLAFRTSAPHLLQHYGFGGDSSALVVLAGDETIAIDPSSGDVIDRFPDEYGLVPTEDPNVVIAIFDDDSIARYDVVRHTPVGRVVDPDFNVDRDFVVNVGVQSWASGDHIVVGGQGRQRIQGVDLAAGRLVAPAIDGAGQFGYLWYATTPDSLYMAALIGDEYRIERRDVDTGELLEVAPGFWDFDFRGGVFVARSVDGLILQLDPVTLEPIGPPFPLLVAPRRGGWMWLDEDASRLMVVDGVTRWSMRIYDVATRTLLGNPVELDSDRNQSGAMLRPDGLEAAIDTLDGILVWDLDPAHWLEAACQLAGRNLTHAEWDQYVGDLAPYRRTCPAYPAA
jgi:DNA-binding SARP family transcriptional activator/WD40 repeat protein